MSHATMYFKYVSLYDYMLDTYRFRCHTFYSGDQYLYRIHAIMPLVKNK